MTTSLLIHAAGRSSVTDLGRYGYAHLGVQTNGAADQLSAREANILVGNPDGAPVIEVVMLAPFEFETRHPVLLAATGAVGELSIDGQGAPANTPLATWPGARVRLEPGATGLRAYVAVRGSILGEEFLGSVAADLLIGVGHVLSDGGEVLIDGAEVPATPFIPLFRPAVTTPSYPSEWTLDVLPGPEAGEFPGLVHGEDGASFEVGERSDQVGARLEGEELVRLTSSEILSRGVPLGAIEVPPSGGAIVLLRGRPVTAGYPVVAVVTRSCHHLLGQLRPGDRVRLRTVTLAAALEAMAFHERELTELRLRCQAMYQACEHFSTSGACGTVVERNEGTE